MFVKTGTNKMLKANEINEPKTHLYGLGSALSVGEMIKTE